MSVPAPHFLLYSEATLVSEDASDDCGTGRWRFVLRDARGETCLDAEDDEPSATSERLELLAIVRGLEALDQPSRVTLVTNSRAIRQGFKYGLAQWRETNWQWERFGQMTPVKNGDLWRRIDRADEIHHVQCREGQLDTSDDLAVPAVVRRESASVQQTRGGRTLRFDGPSRSTSRAAGPSRPAGLGRVVRGLGWSRVFSRLLGRSAASA